MRFFKKLAIFAMAFTFCCGAGLALTACGGENTPDSSVEQTAEGYEFTVRNADGSAAANVNVQLCVLGNAAACYMPMATDANGKVVYNPIGFPGKGEYEIHLLSQDLSTSLEFTGPVTTPTVYGEITLTLK